MENIRSKGLPWEYAQKIYDEGYHIEAFQILHGYLENKLQELLLLVGSTHFNTKLKETWDIVNQIRFISVLKALYVIGQISIGEYKSLLKLNSVRNDVIHKTFLEPYDGELGHKIPKRKLDDIFKKSIEAIHLIEEKIFRLI